jgi:hypothetical protein
VTPPPQCLLRASPGTGILPATGHCHRPDLHTDRPGMQHDCSSLCYLSGSSVHFTGICAGTESARCLQHRPNSTFHRPSPEPLGFASSETGGGLLAAFVHHVMPRWHWQPSLGTLTVSADCTLTKKHLSNSTRNETCKNVKMTAPTTFLGASKALLHYFASRIDA